MNAETRRSTAIHEAGHAVSAWAYDVEMRLVTIRETEDHAGVVHFNPSGFEDDVTCAVVLVAGEIAQRIASGRRAGEDRFNWLNPDGSGDCDAEKARRFTDRTSDPLRTRRLVDVKAASLLRVRWAAVLAIAEELERRTLIYAADVDRLCRAAGALKAGHRRYDPDKHMVSLPNGKRVSMRKWADAVAAAGFNRERATRLLDQKTKSSTERVS